METNTKTKTRIALTNREDYTKGVLNFKWLELPADEAEIQKAFKEINVVPGKNEFFISDYETILHLDKLYLDITSYNDLIAFNEDIKNIEDLDKWDFEILCSVLEAMGSNCLEDTIEEVECGNYTLIDAYDDKELGEYVIENGLFGVEIPAALENYIDFEAIGRDWAFDGCYTDNGFLLYA